MMRTAEISTIKRPNSTAAMIEAYRMVVLGPALIIVIALSCTSPYILLLFFFLLPSHLDPV